MKKIKFVLLLLTVTLLTSCGTSQKQALNLPQLDPKNPEIVELWHYYNSVQKTAFDALVEEFNETVGKEKGVVVEAYNQGNVNDLMTKVLESAEKKVGMGEIPDIFAAYPDTAYEVDKLGLVANLDEYFTEAELAEYRSEFIQEGKFGEGNHLKIFPVAKSTELMFLNLTDFNIFAQACNVTIDDIKTQEGLLEVAKKYYDWTDSLTTTPNDGKAFYGRDSMANHIIIANKQLGNEIFSGSGKEYEINIKEDVLKTIWDYYYIPMIKGYYGAYGRFRSDDAKTGDILAYVGSTTGIAYFPKEVSVNDVTHPVEMVMLEVPNFKDGKPFMVQQGAGMVVSKSNPKKEYAATIFLKWFTEAERNIEFAVNSGYFPVKNSALDIKKVDEYVAKAAKPSLATKSSLEIVLKQLETNELYASKAFEGGSQARKVLENSLGSLAVSTRKEILAKAAAGENYDALIEQYSSEENFKKWYTAFSQELTAVTNKK